MTEKISPNELEKIIPFLLKGEVVGFPTETVYGLAVVYDNLNSFEKLQQVKMQQAVGRLKTDNIKQQVK